MHADHSAPPVSISLFPTALSQGKGLGGYSGTVGTDSRISKVFGWKRVFDVALAGISLPIVLPVLGMVTMWVKCVSRGPAFFRQERVGKDGKLFTLYKLRSMEMASDSAPHRNHIRRLAESDGPMTKLDRLGDTRFIPGGRFLRSAGLDELPQLLNVLAGEMSLVGPRPCLPYELDFYPPGRRQRFDVRPGLTGLWQVSGKNLVTFRQMKAMDLYYSRHVSPIVDMGILAKTPVAVIRQVIGDMSSDMTRCSGTASDGVKGMVLETAESE